MSNVPRPKRVPRPAKKAVAAASAGASSSGARRVGRVRKAGETLEPITMVDKAETPTGSSKIDAIATPRVRTQIKPPANSPQVVAVPRKIGKEKADVHPSTEAPASKSMKVKMGGAAPKKSAAPAPKKAAAAPKKAAAKSSGKPAKRIGKLRQAGQDASEAIDLAALNPPEPVDEAPAKANPAIKKSADGKVMTQIAPPKGSKQVVAVPRKTKGTADVHPANTAPASKSMQVKLGGGAKPRPQTAKKETPPPAAAAAAPASTSKASLKDRYKKMPAPAAAPAQQEQVAAPAAAATSTAAADQLMNTMAELAGKNGLHVHVHGAITVNLYGYDQSKL